MARSLSVLQKASRIDVRSDPFPYLVIKDALPEELYAELAATFPEPRSLGIDVRRNNERWNYFAYKVRKNTGLTQLWRDFIAYHASQSFYDELIALFGDDILAIYPQRFPDKVSLTKKKAGVRKLQDFADADVLLDAMISGNTPVTAASSVRTSHVDLGDKLFSGLFYMRPEGYDAVGGDLTISRFRPEYDTPEKRHALFRDAYVDESCLELVETIAYDRNTVVMFVNTLQSVHGVTVRQPSDKSRLFVNLIAQTDPPLYLLHDDGRPAEYTTADYVSERAKGDGFFKAVLRKLRAA